MTNVEFDAAQLRKEGFVRISDTATHGFERWASTGLLLTKHPKNWFVSGIGLGSGKRFRVTTMAEIKEKDREALHCSPERFKIYTNARPYPGTGKRVTGNRRWTKRNRRPLHDREVI